MKIKRFLFLLLAIMMAVSNAVATNVTFDLKGGTSQFTSAATVLNQGNFYNISGQVPTRAGFTFDGYYDASNKQVWNAQGYAVPGDYWTSDNKWRKSDAALTVYARWRDAAGLGVIELRTGSNGNTDINAVLSHSGLNNSSADQITLMDANYESQYPRYKYSLNLGNVAAYKYAYLLFDYKMKVPAYARLKANFNSTNIHLYNNGANNSDIVPCMAAMYVFDDEQQARTTALAAKAKATAPTDPSGGKIIIYNYNDGSSYNKTSGNIAAVTTFDNSNSSTERDITKYVVYTVCANSSTNWQRGYLLLGNNNGYDTRQYDWFMYVSYDANGGSGTMPTQTVMNAGNLSTSTFTPPTCKRFKNWNSKADGTGTSFTENQAVTAAENVRGPVTLYAQWEEEHHYGANGKCTGCGKNEPAQLVGGYYDIHNAGNLCWFRDLVNAGEGSANAKLTADINLNNELWGNPISYAGSYYTGTFDGQGHTISNLNVKTENQNGGLFGFAQGATIKHLMIENASVVSNLVAGALVGTCSGSNITDCGVTGTVSIAVTDKDDFIRGPIAGMVNQESRISNCFTTEAKLAGVSYDISFQNCYTPADADMAGGEVCYKLNGDQTNILWRQTIGTDTHPVFAATSSVVYKVNVLDCLGYEQDEYTYSNTNEAQIGGHKYVNGICTVCGDFMEPYLGSRGYVIETAGELAWFSNEVNSGHTDIEGTLKADIDLQNMEFTPIVNYEGLFNGAGHTISNLKVVSENTYGGLFANLSGTVQDLIIENADITAQQYAGAIAGFSTGSIKNSAVVGTISLTLLDQASITAGAIAGASVFGGTLTSCYTTAAKLVGMSPQTDPVNCYTPAEADIANGEMCYKLNGDQSNIVWRQTLGEDSYPVPSASHKAVNKVVIAGTDTYINDVLTIEDGQSFEAPENFTAASVTFNRSIVKDGGMYSFIVPFDIPAVQAAVLGKFYQYNRAEEGKVYFDDIAVVGDGIVKANTAYFFDPANNITSITVENTQIKATTSMSDATAPSALGLYGTYSQIDVPEGAYGYGNAGSFVKAGEGNTLRPFRAYLWLGSDVPMANARAFFGDYDVDAIEFIGADDLDLNAPIYNLQGQRIVTPKKGEIYIQNGKKVTKK